MSVLVVVFVTAGFVVQVALLVTVVALMARTGAPSPPTPVTPAQRRTRVLNEQPSWPLLCQVDPDSDCWPDFCAGHDVLMVAIATAQTSQGGRPLTAAEVAVVRRRVEMTLMTRAIASSRHAGEAS